MCDMLDLELDIFCLNSRQLKIRQAVFLILYRFRFEFVEDIGVELHEGDKMFPYFLHGLAHDVVVVFLLVADILAPSTLVVLDVLLQ